MTEKDFQKRRMFPRSNSKQGIEYWTRDIAFYLDGVSFVYKGNPTGKTLVPYMAEKTRRTANHNKRQ